MIKGLERLKKIQVGLSQFSAKVRKIALIAAYEEMANLEADMVARTPVDTGHASSKWSEIRQTENELSFELDIPYGFVLDAGSEPGKKPWPSPGPRTRLYKGRVFSSQVAGGEGGIKDEILTEQRQGEIADNILDKVERTLTNAMG